MNKDENLQAQRTKFSNPKRFDNAAIEDYTQNYKMNGTSNLEVSNWNLESQFCFN